MLWEVSELFVFLKRFFTPKMLIASVKDESVFKPWNYESHE